MYRTRPRKKAISATDIIKSKRAKAIVACMALALILSVGYQVFSRWGTGEATQSDSVILRHKDGENKHTEEDSQKKQVKTEDKKENFEVKTNHYVIHIDGAVVTPGVYSIDKDAAPRVQDFVDLAGGLTPEADTTLINLAAYIQDGQKLHIPKEGEETLDSASAGSHANEQVSAAPEEKSLKVNINTATADELQTLPGVGKATAENIVSDRDKNGPFAAIEDLMRISGIGQKKFDKLKESLYV